MIRLSLARHSSQGRKRRRVSADTLLFLSLIVLLQACSSGTSSDNDLAIPCAGPAEECAARLAIGGGLYLRYYRSHPLDRRNQEVREALIIVHGAGRAAEWNFETGILASSTMGRLQETAVIAPKFIILEDEPAPDEAYWTSNGWKKGHLSVSDVYRPYRISSYAVTEQIIRILDDESLFPNLQAIVVAGHSAGGQYSHRFAAGNRVEQELTGVSIRYVVANPSTYLYLGLERVVPGTFDEFAIPDVAACPDYNVWHYGLEWLNTYMSALTVNQIRNQLVSRNVAIMVGSEDRGTAQLDMSCGAMLEGANRYFRGLILVNYMDAFWPGHNHTLQIVPGVAHSSRGMFMSDQGLEALFLPSPVYALSPLQGS